MCLFKTENRIISITFCFSKLKKTLQYSYSIYQEIQSSDLLLLYLFIYMIHTTKFLTFTTVIYSTLFWCLTIIPIMKYSPQCRSVSLLVPIHKTCNLQQEAITTLDFIDGIKDQELIGIFI